MNNHATSSSLDKYVFIMIRKTKFQLRFFSSLDFYKRMVTSGGRASWSLVRRYTLFLPAPPSSTPDLVLKCQKAYIHVCGYPSLQVQGLYTPCKRWSLGYFSSLEMHTLVPRRGMRTKELGKSGTQVPGNVGGTFLDPKIYRVT